ncbi:phosphoribosyl-ATP diphosphatase [Acutalibacter sp. 1XD8-36]|uniref:phosphoribosyl-ATP diphosphatase n=1 Tax=Acutalibacter sp. 1XD8-36 TaxID=2320852 RepID=UPI00263225F0|nr:phosphoribosyl-ATP diphosphatase [Acutalibacter sp. 1XD8-36]
MNAMEKLYQVILERKTSAQEGSYTGYLFEQGLDKILKKCAEECGEVIIAAKSGRVEDTIGEISDLLYHLTVLIANEGIAWEQVEAELERRAQKQGNLKKFHQVDKDT